MLFYYWCGSRDRSGLCEKYKKRTQTAFAWNNNFLFMNPREDQISYWLYILIQLWLDSTFNRFILLLFFWKCCSTCSLRTQQESFERQADKQFLSSSCSFLPENNYWEKRRTLNDVMWPIVWLIQRSFHQLTEGRKNNAAKNATVIKNDQSECDRKCPTSDALHHDIKDTLWFIITEKFQFTKGLILKLKWNM